MLDDRDYMRHPADSDGPSFARLANWHSWSLTVLVLVVNVVVFLFECAISPQPLGLHPDPFSDYYHYLALSRAGLAHGYIWQLLTYQFMHASVLHIVFNCWALYVFGRFLETVLGPIKFLLILLSSGVVGGLVQVLTAVLWPQYFDSPVVGASAGVFGLVAAFATLYPERELTMLVFFVIPVTLRARTLLIFSAVLAVSGIVFPDLLGAHVANAAHLGGMLMGVLFVLGFIKGRWFQRQVVENPWQPGSGDAPAAKSSSIWRPKPARTDADLSADELLKTQVDPILDKISAHGLHSLTAREREILEKASGKLAKR
jgi:membrane associated rhomboid family serine protease